MQQHRCIHQLQVAWAPMPLPPQPGNSSTEAQRIRVTWLPHHQDPQRPCPPSQAAAASSSSSKKHAK
jgi:hypothetical protein